MKKEFISELFKKFEDACYDFDGVECWSARELQDILGYSQWRNFKNVIDKSQKSCEKAGILSELKKREHFEKPSVRKKKKSIAARKRAMKKTRRG